MSVVGMTDTDHSACGDCSCHSAQTSVQQTLDEMDFERGIWGAAVSGTVEDVQHCLDVKHINPNVTDTSGYTALHYACRRGHTEICRLLLDRGASVNVQTKSGGVTPLHRAAYRGNCVVVEMLLTSGADPLTKDADGQLPTHKAAESGDLATIKALVSACPASVREVDKRSRRPLDCLRPEQQGDGNIRSLLEDPT